MRRCLRMLVSAGVAGLLLAVAAGAGGQEAGVAGKSTPLGADFRISGAGAQGEDGYPAVAWNATTNQYLVVWQDQRSAATRGADIYGRLVDAQGVPVGADFRISGPNATEDDLRPAVVWNGAADQYLVVWQDQRNSPAHHGDIYGRRVSATGAVAGMDFPISSPGATAEWPAAAWNGTANQYLVVWQDDRDEATHVGDIYGRRLSATGAVVGADFPISSPAAGGKVLPAVAWNGTANQYLVVWQDERDETTRGSDIYGRRVSAQGAVVGPERRISGPAAKGNDWWPAVAWNGAANQYLVVWGDERDSSRGFDVRGRLVSADGTAVRADFRISGRAATASDESPVVVWNETANEYLVVWMDGRDDAHRADRGCDIYGRRVSAAGAPAGAEFRISGPGATTDDVLPAMAWDRAANRYLVVWSEARNFLTSNWDIFGRQVAG